MKFNVRLAVTALDDLECLHEYVTEVESIALADELVNNLQIVCSELDTLPNRGHFTPELKDAIRAARYREVHHHAYRIIYRVIESDVVIIAILDGHRDLKTHLHERILRP